MIPCPDPKCRCCHGHSLEEDVPIWGKAAILTLLALGLFQACETLAWILYRLFFYV